MNSSQFATSSSEEEFLTPTPMTNLLFSRSLETRGEKSLSPEAITKVSMCSLEYDRSMASTTMRISAEFLPLYDRRGISISSMAASWKPPCHSAFLPQSADPRVTMILPFSTSRSRTRPTSNVLYLASRAPRAIFSKSMKRASLRSSFICLPYARRKPRRLVTARGLSHSHPATISITNKSSIRLKDTSSRLARPDLPHGEDSAGASRGPLYARHTNKESRTLGRDPTQIRQVFDPPPVGGQDCKMRAEVCGWAGIQAGGGPARPAPPGGPRPVFFSHALISSIRPWVPGSRRTRPRMSMTTAGTTRLSWGISAADQPCALKWRGASTWVPLCAWPCPA